MQITVFCWLDEVTARRCGCCTSLLHFSACCDASVMSHQPVAVLTLSRAPSGRDQARLP